MECDFCEGATEVRRVRKQYWFRGRLYLVENVEAEVCSQCGQRYFHAKTLDAVDELLAKEHAVKETLAVEVVSM
jgi:YgiT-type zinc finger domain-containing protein